MGACPRPGSRARDGLPGPGPGHPASPQGHVQMLKSSNPAEGDPSAGGQLVQPGEGGQARMCLVPCWLCTPVPGPAYLLPARAHAHWECIQQVEAHPLPSRPLWAQDGAVQKQIFNTAWAAAAPGNTCLWAGPADLG